MIVTPVAHIDVITQRYPVERQSTPDPKLVRLAAAEATMEPAALVSRWDALIANSAHRFGVPENWIRAVVAAESGGRTVNGDGKPIVSRVGAMGLMQVMPETYAEMRRLHGLGADPFNARDNIFAGAAYLHWLQTKYGYPAMFAAYNAGPGRLEDHLLRGQALPAETIAYVAKISGEPDNGSAGKLEPMQLTKPDGSSVSIDPGTVDSVRAALPYEFAPGVRSVIKMGKRMQGVQENIPRVLALLHRKSRSA